MAEAVHQERDRTRQRGAERGRRRASLFDGPAGQSCSAGDNHGRRPMASDRDGDGGGKRGPRARFPEPRAFSGRGPVICWAGLHERRFIPLQPIRLSSHTSSGRREAIDTAVRQQRGSWPFSLPSSPVVAAEFSRWAATDPGSSALNGWIRVLGRPAEELQRRHQRPKRGTDLALQAKSQRFGELTRSTDGLVCLGILSSGSSSSPRRDPPEAQGSRSELHRQMLQY